MVAPFYRMKEKARVMLVDHNKEFDIEMVELLKSCEFKVMMVGEASTAMTMLSKEKEKVDVMIINVHSPDQLSFQLLSQAVALDIVSLFVCDEHNELLGKKALKDGAYLFLKRPLDKGIVKYLWQFVYREKHQKEKANEGSEIGNTNVGDEQAGEKNLPNTMEGSNNIHGVENDVVSNEKYKLRRKRDRKSIKETTEGEIQSSANKVVRQRLCIKWTVDLHAKFVEVVHQLGEGRYYPKNILEVMNVPDLSRTQVASHLFSTPQKCRNNKWRALEERKSIRRPSGKGSSSDSLQRSSLRKVGTMSRLQKNVSNLQQQHHRNPDQTQRAKEFSFSSLYTNNSFARGESSTQQQLYRRKLQVQPHYLSIGNPFNNSFLSTQSNVGGGLQQHGPLFGMVDSQGLKNPIIGSINNRPGLELNNRDHHTHNGYNLDLNAAYVTTYSGDHCAASIDNFDDQ